jgi:predicted DNA-binding transcriptional regulator AlpA
MSDSPNIVKAGHVQPKAPLISLDQPGRLMTCHVLALSGWSHSTLYVRINAGLFPPPKKDGRLNYWTTGTVREALDI